MGNLLLKRVGTLAGSTYNNRPLKFALKL